jgi:membrane protease YdiL (CAAX protease family)
MEEIAFRSYPLILLQESYGARFTIYVGALAFAMYHYIPGGNLLGSLLGTGIWGVVYGLLAIWTKGIAFPTGFHFALNLSQAIFGMKEPYTPIWNLIDGGPENNYFNFDMDQVGLAAQLLVLLLSVFFIEFYVRKSNKS